MTTRRPIAVFYHCLFAIGSRKSSSIEPKLAPLASGSLPAAIAIVRSQVDAMQRSGLLDAADHLFVGINGNVEDFEIAAELLPKRAIVHFHGRECRNELRTILMLERFVAEKTRFDTDADWSICYHHAKGASHPIGDKDTTKWRRCMEKHVIHDWRKCVAALAQGFDAAGAHYLIPPTTPGDQRIFAGNFFWARSRYLKTVPSLLERKRIHDSGIEALESRYEAEVYVANRRPPPRVFVLHSTSFEGCEKAKSEVKEG